MIKTLLACALTLALPAAIPEALGSGRRGWLFSQDVPHKMDHPGTYRVAISYDPNPPLDSTPMGHVPGQSVLVCQDVLTTAHLKSIRSEFWGGWTSFLCYSFDTQELFSFNNLIRLEQGKPRIYPDSAQFEARSRFGLGPDQLYLGVVDGRRFYWVKGRPREVLFFKDGEAPRRLYRWKLDRRVAEPLGIAKGNPAGDFALRAVAHPRWLSLRGRSLTWFVLNERQAERVAAN
jgi:hypothetical protein